MGASPSEPPGGSPVPAGFLPDPCPGRAGGPVTGKGLAMAAVDARRIEDLNDRPPEPGGRFVLYWMQAAQRAAHNPALEQAIALADQLGQGVVVGFGLMDGYPEANHRHYAFMLEGLKETAATLRGRGIRFVLRRGDPPEVALGLARKGSASVVVCDVGYTRFQRAWRERVAREAGRRVVSVEGEDRKSVV